MNLESNGILRRGDHCLPGATHYAPSPTRVRTLVYSVERHPMTRRALVPGLLAK